MKEKIILLSMTLALMGFNTQAQTPDWQHNVASIIYNNCSSCHREGGIGPFRLMSYSDAVLNSASIKAEVQAHIMPPWQPDPNYVHFKGERILSDADINTLAAWVDGGTPAGDTTLAPAPPTFPVGSQMPVIDQNIQWPSWTITTDVDEYRTFVIHSGYAQDVYLNQIEYLPGNGSAVHHMVLFYDTGPTSWILDQLDPDPGYESYGLGPVSPSATFIGAWAPGSGIFELPSNMGIRIPAGADIGIEIHYSPGEAGQKDSSQLNFKFTTDASPREVFVAPVLTHLFNMTDGPLFIPANTVKSFHEKYYMNNADNSDVSLVSVFPHMHKVGTEIHSFAVDQNLDTTKLVSIPKWSFHWQGFYEYQKLIHITNHSTFWAEAAYDNTTNNPDNPSNPPIDVSAGEHTTDEMMIVFWAFLEYQSGDENIVLDSTVMDGLPVIPDQQHGMAMHIYPNPVLDDLNVGMQMQYADRIQFSLMNIDGKNVRSWSRDVNQGASALSFSLTGLPAGIYLLRAASTQGYATVKVIRQ